ncbi:extracellular solute-binding protein [Paenibacillus sp. LMG 31460]|uniref:Extracellular solute-binding protein n=1 Tax=Paenibacillus germinis TaxID=2654979 RepID=A0ABX1ZCB5_9BACL|nr:extracellular solute-binding protein [Paenibacillus germinis]NOU90985.1 extracellular solute-binding protein [Paenibacillus germinis]
MKKGLYLFMMIMLSMTLIAGCSEKKQEGGQAATTNPEKSGALTKKTFTMLTDSHPSYPYNKDWPVWKMIEEKTGATFNVQTPSGKLEDTINLSIASGDMPDLMFMYGRTQTNKFGQQGALVNILDYKADMPNFTKWMEKYPEIAKAQLAADGKMYMFPNEGFGEANRMIWMYRQDVFQKHNLTAPTNFDELYTVLKKLKELYPKSYPFSFRLGNNLLLLKVLSANFQTNEGFYLDGRDVKYGPTEQSYQKMLGYLNKFYKEGLMPPDWLTVDAKKWQDLMSTEQSFVTVDYIGRIDFFNDALRKSNPNFNLTFMVPPIGNQGGKAQNAYMHVVDSGLTVSIKSKQIKDIMRTVDFLYSEEGRLLSSWGTEGKTYMVDNGKKKIKPDYKTAIDFRKETGLATNGTYTWVDYDAYLSMASKELQDAYVEARKYDAPYRSLPDFNQKDLETITTTGAAIDKYRDENVIKFIIGEQSLDNWSNYVKSMDNLGLPKLQELYKTGFLKNSK